VAPSPRPTFPAPTARPTTSEPSFAPTATPCEALRAAGAVPDPPIIEVASFTTTGAGLEVVFDADTDQAGARVEFVSCLVDFVQTRWGRRPASRRA